MTQAVVQTNHKKGSVADVKYKRKVRLILWGGAAKESDNSAFLHSKNNVKKTYAAIDSNKFTLIDKRVATAKDIVDAINAQEPNSIRSVDIWSHGGPQALYLTTASEDTPEQLRYLLHNTSLYRSRTRMYLNAAGWTSGSALVGDIKFDRFTDDAKIELHGCSTAANPEDEDNIAADLSERLARAGKSRSAVIGHVDKANPLIDNLEPVPANWPKQDYRHGKRVVFHAGKVVRSTTQSRHIDEATLVPAKR